MHQKIFGKLPSGEHLERIQQSTNYKNGVFNNLSRTPVMAEDSSFWKTLKSYLNKPKDTSPPAILPSVRTNLHSLPAGNPVIVWFGHSSYLLHINGMHILVDPVFSGHAAPFSFMVKAYPGSNIYSVDDLPVIDLLIQTHDHYDHLDYTTITQLKSKIKKIVTALGVGSHFEYWGFDKNIISEFDWWNTQTVAPGIALTAAPARHFSGRGIKRGKTLWASFILKTATHNIYIGGDSGYDTHFKEIGNKYGPFDIAILEAGQYNAHWPHIHMMPEETVQACADLQAKVLLPVHWGKFTLSLHPWNEPVKRVIKKAAELNIKVTTPMIGEPVILDSSYPSSHWWEI
jgi:L-ascorbate metabolism protein UlaG (beta-lactamase superfamily)